MADDWEDWEDDQYEPTLPGASKSTVGAADTLGSALLTKAKEPDALKFAGEDEEEDEDPLRKRVVPPPQQKKEVISKYDESRGKTTGHGLEDILEDPIAEKLRQQKCAFLQNFVVHQLVEDADLKAAEELFGATVDLDTFEPKTAKDFEEFAKALFGKYLRQQERSAHYKVLAKALVRQVLAPLDVAQVKDVEVMVAGVRSDKLKEEKAAAAARKQAGKKKSINVGRSGGSAGLDDYTYDDQALDNDDYDFM